MPKLNFQQIYSIILMLLLLFIEYCLARGGRKGGGRSSGRSGSRMKKKLCCGGLAGIDNSGKKMADWIIAVLVFLAVIALYMMYALIRWIYVRRMQGRLSFNYTNGIHQRETTTTTDILNPPSYV